MNTYSKSLHFFKKYLKMSEIASMCGVSTRSLENWNNSIPKNKHPGSIKLINLYNKFNKVKIVQKHLKMSIMAEDVYTEYTKRNLRGRWSAKKCSDQILSGTDWRIALFNFVDDLRASKNFELIREPINDEIEWNLYALISSTINTLCDELEIEKPEWSKGKKYLQNEWYVSELKSVRKFAAKESPYYFRKNNIFVLENFLSRA